MKPKIENNPQREIYYSLMNKYEKSLIELGKSEEDIEREMAEYIQFYSMFFV